MTGRTILHYEVLEKLGAGGMGEIYRARDPRLNRSVAIKALPAGSTADPDRRRRFIQEAQAASGLNHPNIITIHDILSQDGSDYMVMEYVSGKTLGDLIPNTGLGAAIALQYGVQIADALASAHAAGIVHRDLKPGNVMITESGRVKILDFGLAKVTIANVLTEDTQTIGAAPMTVEGSILGTVSYMSPEQAQGKRVDARSDIFAFGALLYEMVTGRKAFPGDSAITTLTSILRDDVPPMRNTIAGVPPELEEIVDRALRKDPSQRWQTMQEVHGQLAALKQKLDSGVLPPHAAAPVPAAPARPPRVRSRARMAWIALGLFLAANGWWRSQRRRDEKPLRPPVSSVTTPGPAPAAPEQPSPAPVPAAEDGVMTNETVLDLVRAKVAEKVIVSQIRSAPRTRFTLSTPEIIRLTKAGVPPAVIETMRDPGLPATPAEVKLPDVETRSVTLIGGVPFEIELTADVPNNPEPGAPLQFRAKQDFSMAGAVVIAKGALVTGEVTEGKKGILGRAGKPSYRLNEVEAVDGSKIKLRTAPGNSDRTERPIEPPGRRDKNVLAPAGTAYLAYIDGDQTVHVKQ
jgi:serine/threonine-protein kinase